MANSKGSSNVRNLTYVGKHSLLPPKSPFPSISPSYTDCAPRSAMGYKGAPNPRDGSSFHQRTSSESQLIEEQPSWLDELLNEPDTPVQKGGHRRSSSDSFAYVDATNVTNLENLVQDQYNSKKNAFSVPSWGSRDSEQFKDVQRAHLYKELSSFRNHKHRTWDPTFNFLTSSSGLPGSSCIPQEGDVIPSTATKNHDQVEYGTSDQKSSSERNECSVAKPSASEADTKRAKQQFAQRSRVRKLQYIAELERNVQALQAQGAEVSAELEFINQQNLILGMENKALKQRLESVSQEQLIKYLEHEVLEREMGRLQILYQQQQQRQQQQQQQQRQPSSSHRRSKSSSDLDSQFGNLSLKHKEPPNSDGDSVTSTLRI